MLKGGKRKWVDPEVEDVPEAVDAGGEIPDRHDVLIKRYLMKTNRVLQKDKKHIKNKNLNVLWKENKFAIAN